MAKTRSNKITSKKGAVTNKTPAKSVETESVAMINKNSCDGSKTAKQTKTVKSRKRSSGFESASTPATAKLSKQAGKNKKDEEIPSKKSKCTKTDSEEGRSKPV